MYALIGYLNMNWRESIRLGIWGLWAHVWEAHLSWLATVDGYSSWCSICQEGGAVLLCDEDGCGAVQHAACSMQNDSTAQHW